ncbi:MAG TPA: LPS export ABC transporter periplasmic protein LptC [Atribacteraceae bacterium]|nr:LPS export ABC transporter periplasmic protein LptC [Atribacteraceae bacterium]
MWKKWLVIIGVCFAGFLIVFLSLENRPPEAIGEVGEEEEEEGVDVQPVIMRDIQIRGWEDGRLSWVLAAQEMEYNKATSQALSRGEVELLILREDGEKRAVLNAGRASINLDAGDFHFQHQVQVVSADGNRIVTQSLLYRDETKVLEALTLTRTYFGENSIESLGLITDLDFTQPEFLEVSQGRFVIGSTPNEQPEPEVQPDIAQEPVG